MRGGVGCSFTLPYLISPVVVARPHALARNGQARRAAVSGTNGEGAAGAVGALREGELGARVNECVLGGKGCRWCRYPRVVMPLTRSADRMRRGCKPVGIRRDAE